MALYTVQYETEIPPFTNREKWERVEFLEVNRFLPESSDHHPQTHVRLLYNELRICGLFEVNDFYVISGHRGLQVAVFTDSCVEFFVQPPRCEGYFNFEFNCTGAMLCSYITDHRIVNGRFKEFIMVEPEDLKSVELYHTLSGIIEPEKSEPCRWYLGFSIPFFLIKKYSRYSGSAVGQEWRANFYKCADASSHPHWAAWAPVPILNFHLPEYFGTLKFQKKRSSHLAEPQ